MADFPADLVTPPSIVLGSPQCLGSLARFQSLNANTPSTWQSANRAQFTPIVVGAPFTAVQMFVVNGATASGNIDVGIYTSEGNKIVAKGSTAQAGTSVMQAFDITDTLLNPGLYYLAVAMDNTTGTLACWQFSNPEQRSLGIFQMATAFALPTTATFAAATGSNVFGVWVTSRTVI